MLVKNTFVYMYIYVYYLIAEADINYLMLIALDKLVFYPFAYIMDKFRWNVFSGEISENEYTAKWWEYK